MDIRREMEQLTDRAVCVPDTERPEVRWLKEQFQIFIHMNGVCSKKDADALLYERLYHRPPKKASDILKIRYWRTGRHLPSNYRECLAFGLALELDHERLRFLMQNYYDSCDLIFWQAPRNAEDAGLQTTGLWMPGSGGAGENNEASPYAVYHKRLKRMTELVERYLSQISSSRLKQMNIDPDERSHYIRHLYYTDALQCVYRDDSPPDCNLIKHISSINYASELKRNLKLLGFIPRKTMIRHLFLLGMPELSPDFVNETLTGLGYLPLHPEHTLRTGERLDALLIGLLQLFDRTWIRRNGSDHTRQIQEALRILDKLLARQGQRHMRFMLFKALETL